MPTIAQPKTSIDFDQYFDFRWKVLRAPLGLPRGSEKDDLEDVSFHLSIRSETGEIIGVGKFKPYSEDIVQISHIAIDEAQRGAGLGKQLIHALEAEAIKRGHKEVFLTAREYNISYFENRGYRLGEEVESPLPNIKIFKMHKLLQR